MNKLKVIVALTLTKWFQNNCANNLCSSMLCDTTEPLKKSYKEMGGGVFSQMFINLWNSLFQNGGQLVNWKVRLRLIDFWSRGSRCFVNWRGKLNWGQDQISHDFTKRQDRFDGVSVLLLLLHVMVLYSYTVLRTSLSAFWPTFISQAKYTISYYCWWDLALHTLAATRTL